ncbi:Variant SH3 domain-containing protein [Rheinheimera pacifica]|uniref:Variant SH3 domain-containing protein n=1 Tax=Rheinheimera pacifica TaxID=173990 RepID=A0A1H6LGQ9_9GAMM|nr:SH3 domain-containing protein [Rheinheimera pacifica]SEH87630.1 Variant SH3 domain-containing protein [Rheinheimera pacifica]
MSPKRYIVVSSHKSEFPKPITIKKGDPLLVGEEYKGAEGWDNWYLCTTPGQEPGWVPGQIIGRCENSHGKALDDYTAKELNVQEGELLTGSRVLNGWLWCEKMVSTDFGWVPLENVKEVAQ